MCIKTIITDLPLDAWVIVLMYVDNNNLLESFNVLVNSRAINIPLKYRLNTFWTVMSQARYLSQKKIEKEISFPNSDIYKSSFGKLIDMGVPIDKASDAVGRAYGNIEEAMKKLGWD